MGAVYLLFIAADNETQVAKLLEYYETKEIDTNNRNELCPDRFIDIVGQKRVERSGCKGFLEMNILNSSLLEKVLVQEWGADKGWLESVLLTPRTKSYLEWRDAAKAARKERRKRSAQDLQQKKEAQKKLKLEHQEEGEAPEESKQESEPLSTQVPSKIHNTQPAQMAKDDIINHPGTPTKKQHVTPKESRKQDQNSVHPPKHSRNSIKSKGKKKKKQQLSDQVKLN